MKDIPNFEGKYAVNETGEVFSYRKGAFLKQANHSAGYRQVQLGRGNLRLVHRLVAETYLENPKNLPQVNHINGDKTDNRLENLEWCTNGQNLLHSVKIGTYNHSRRTSDKYLKKVNREDIQKIIRLRNEGQTLVQIAEQFGITHPMVSRYCRGLFQSQISHA